MKFLIVLALAVIGATAAPTDDQDVVAVVTDVINQILEQIPEPALDLHDEKASLDLGFEQLDFTFTNVVLSGIKNLEIKTLTFDEDTGRLEYDYTLPEITANVEFYLALTGILEAINHPVVDVVLNNLKFSGSLVLDTSGPIQVTELERSITLEGAKVDLTGILNDDALTEKLETILNEQLPTIVNDIAVQLEPVASPLIKAILNIILRVTS